LSLIKTNSNINAGELASKIGINTRNVEKNIEKLKTRGIIVRIGPDKGGYWKITDKLNNK
jgi:predicted HTH transcriptional regulator